MVAFRTIFVTLFLASSSFALPATTTLDSSLLGTRAVPAKRAPAPSAARRGLQKKKHVDSTHIPGNKKDYSPFLCPSPEAPVASTANTPAIPLNKNNVVTQLRACPAPGTGIVGDIVRDMTPNELGAQMNTLADWFRIGFECIDFDNDVKNCGGCASFGLGQDCSAIPSATRATCSQASCHVAACQPGFVISKDKKSCVERSHKGGPDDELMDEAWEEEERLLEESDKQKVIGRKSSSR